jgi:YfiH family protein
VKHKGIIHKSGWFEKGGVIRAQLFADVPGLLHGFTTRSCGDFREGETAGKLVSGENAKGLRLLKQVHGVRLCAPFEEEERPSADGWSGIPPPGVLLGVKTADCLSLLLYEEKSGAMAAVHAGWRSAVAGICLGAVEEMIRDDASVSGIKAAIGPSIGPCCFEVGPEVAEAGGKHPECFRRGEGDRFFFDLPTYCREELLGAGVLAENILTLGLCTKCEEELFFSHRRGDKGRMCSFIGRVP